MNNVVGELCLPQEDPGGKQHPLNRSREQGREAFEGEGMSSTSFTDQQFMSLQSFYRTVSGRNISEEHKEFLDKCLRQPPRNFCITGFSPHTVVKIIISRLLVGTFYKQSCFVWDVELDRKSSELSFIHIICKPSTLNEDQQQEDPPFHLVENVVPNCQLHNLNNIDSNCLREKWQLLFQERRNNKSAIAGVFKGDCLIQTFHAEKPRFLKGENTLHYEELLIGEIDPYLENMAQEPHNGAPEGGRMEIFFYIRISPCFKRETETIVPCFFLLLENANLWQKKYNCHTYVGFTDYFGPLSSCLLDKIPKSEFLRINSVFHPYAEKSENDRIKLNWEKIKKRIYFMKKEKKFQKIRNWNTDFKKCLKNLQKLAKSKSKLNQHLIDGTEIITSSGFDSTVKNEIQKVLCTIWEEAIKNKKLELIKEEFTADYNKKIVEYFLKFQNFSSRDDSLQFYLIEKQHLTINMLQSD